MEVRCGLSLAAGVRQDKQEFAGGLLMKSGTHGKATRPVDRRLTSADADIGLRGDGHREQIYCSGSRTGSIHVCSNSGAFAQDKPAPSTGMVLRSADNPDAQQMALMHRQIDSVKKQAIAANVTLTDTEATKFWPVYEQYSAKLRKITDTKTALIKEYAEEYGSLTDQQADSLIRRWLDSDIATFELRRKYLPIFSKVLSGKVTATIFQVEHRISAMIDLQLTSRLPLMQSQGESAEVH